jgi:hypothetical protein
MGLTEAADVHGVLRVEATEVVWYDSAGVMATPEFGVSRE